MRRLPTTRRREYETHLTGRCPLYDASSGGGDGPSVLTEALIGGVGALIILLFVFGTLPAVAMPLVVAVASILNTFTLVWLLTYVTDVSIIVQFLIALVGLGVAIDYALLMIFRFREELAQGEDTETALDGDDDARRQLGDRLRLDGRRRPAEHGHSPAAVHPLDRDRRHADPGGLGDRLDHAAAGAAGGARPADQQRAPDAEALRRTVGDPESGLWGGGRSSSSGAPGSSRPSGMAIVGVLVVFGLQLNPSEAQAKDFPGRATRSSAATPSQGRHLAQASSSRSSS